MDLSVIVFSTHLKLDSFKEFSRNYQDNNKFLFVTPHRVYPNEIEKIKEFVPNSEFISFSDLLTDKDMEQCDISADREDILTLAAYYDKIKEQKNQLLIERLKERYSYVKGYIFNDDLGIDIDCWLKEGFQPIQGSYYYKNERRDRKLSEKILLKFKSLVGLFNKDAYVATYKGEKFVFYGSMNRISYRLNIQFQKSIKEKIIRGIEKLYIKFINSSGFKRNVQRLTTFHEYEPIGLHVPLTVIQDGYLPQNYTSRYMKYFVGKIDFLAWDQIGLKTFINQNLPAKIIPFRSKLYLPTPKFSKKISKVLCVSSGAGDWTAIKNRSDEDMMVIAFAEIARKNPDIEFVYRCHPVWIIPQHQGVNSISRVNEYYKSLGLSNLHVSSNIPPAYQEGKMILSYRRTSLEEDLKDVDLMFGEHSISMIDGAFKQIPFASVNLTGRRDLFESISELGFPHCESIEDINKLIGSFNTESFKNSYLKAIDNYNSMTDQE